MTSDIVSVLVRRRRELGLRQADVAHEMGINQSTMSGMEHESNDPRLSTLLRYAAAVGAELVLLEGELETEYGVRFLVPHANAGIAVWAPDAVYAAHMMISTRGMAEIVTRRCTSWETA
jgi:transcriptional regulator with XRE-family HTH domain